MIRRLSDDFVLAVSDTVVRRANRRPVARFERRNGRRPKLAHPEDYAEKMLWRKLLDRNPRFVEFADKLAAKDYCRRTCPSLAIPRTLWVGERSSAIPDDLLAGDVFVKANHGCNFNYPVRNGRVDRADLEEKTSLWLRSVHGVKKGQWAYRMVEPRLFVEESVGDVASGLLEVNVRASNGKFILGSVIGHNKTPDKWTVFLDENGKPTAGTGSPADAPVRELPDDLEIDDAYRRALDFTRTLSLGIDYARFDFMWNGSELFAGEITVCPGGGLGNIANPAVNSALSEGWDLGASHLLTAPQTGFKRLYAEALNRRLQART